MRINKHFPGAVSVLSKVLSAAIFSRILHDLVQDMTVSFPSVSLHTFQVPGFAYVCCLSASALFL